MKKILINPKEYKGKSGLTGRMLIYLGVFLILCFVFFKLIPIFISGDSTGFLKNLYDFSSSPAPESFIALGLVVTFFGFLLLFFSHQFSKLAEIADEIENNEEFLEEDED